MIIRAQLHVSGQRGFSGQFRECPAAQPAQRVHLEQPILRRNVTLQEVEIVLVGGVDVSDAHFVACDLRLRLQTCQLCRRRVVLARRSAAQRAPD